VAAHGKNKVKDDKFLWLPTVGLKPANIFLWERTAKQRSFVEIGGFQGVWQIKYKFYLVYIPNI
jgi:hypothetical protein